MLVGYQGMLKNHDLLLLFLFAAVKQGFVVEGSRQYLISSTCWFYFALELKGTKTEAKLTSLLFTEGSQATVEKHPLPTSFYFNLA